MGLGVYCIAIREEPLEWDSEGYYEIKVQDGQARHLLHVRAKGKIFKDELD